MCVPVDPITAFTVATTAVQSLGAAKDARHAASAAEAGATNEARASAERASRLWAQGQTVLADQRSQFLASPGVEAGSGSDLEVGAADAGTLHVDMLTELFGGTTRATALRKEAKGLRANARLQTGLAVGAAAALVPTVWGALSGGKAASSIKGLGTSTLGKGIGR